MMRKLLSTGSRLLLTHAHPRFQYRQLVTPLFIHPAIPCSSCRAFHVYHSPNPHSWILLLKHSRNGYRAARTSPVTGYFLSRTFNTSSAGDYAQVTSVNTKASFPVDLEQFPPERIRNFSIIAHVDHGKSTLADRLLEVTGTISKSSDNKQILDRLQVERERGITVKAQTSSMIYKSPGDGITYLLNLIDTPGHVDFSYEVARSMKACQGVILLVDANQGVQAQTVANFYLAFEHELPIIPVLNKIDLKHARPDAVMEQLESLFDIVPETVLKVSAKNGIGIEELLEAVVKRIPPPKGKQTSPPKGLIFDSWYDKYRGVAMLVAIHDGCFKLGQSISLASTKKSYEIKDIGVLYPDPVPMKTVYAGQVAYILCSMKSIQEAHMGDTVYATDKPVEPFEGFTKAKPMVYAGVYPMDQSELPQLRQALEKLVLNDPSVSCVVESSPALGQGWRMGFLGVLHMDVFNQRLEQEYDAEVVLTSPHVPVKLKIHGAKNIKHYGGTDMLTLHNPSSLPNPDIIVEMYEPFVNGTIITPDVYTSEIMSLCMDCRGEHKSSKNLSTDRVLMTFKLPLNEIIIDFFDKLKSITSGYASFDYEEAGYEVSSLVKLDILLNGEVVEEMSTIVHVTKARDVGKSICGRLKEIIARHQFPIAIQAVARGKILARDDIKAVRKDVTAKLHGGDIQRKKKLLKRQAEGKRRMKMVGKIEMPRETFIKILQK